MLLIDTILPNQRYKIFISPLNQGGWGGYKYDILHRAFGNRGYTIKTCLHGFETFEGLKIDPLLPPLKRGEKRVVVSVHEDGLPFGKGFAQRLYSPRL